MASKRDESKQDVLASKQTNWKVNTFKAKVVAILQEINSDASTWSASATVVGTFETSKMWSDWLSAGHNHASLVNFIGRLKKKYGKRAT